MRISAARSYGDSARSSSMYWPNSDSSSSPTGFSSEIGACAVRWIESTSSGSIPVTSAISAAVGSRPSSVDELALGADDLVEPLDDVDGDADRARLVGERPRCTAWRIHQVA